MATPAMSFANTQVPSIGVTQPGLFGVQTFVPADATDPHFHMAVRNADGDRIYGASRDPNPNIPQYLPSGTQVDYLRDPPPPKSALTGDYGVAGRGQYGDLPELRQWLTAQRNIEMIPSDNSFAIYLPQMCAQREIRREREFLVQQDVRNVVRDGKAYIYTISTGAKYESYYPPEAIQWARGP